MCCRSGIASFATLKNNAEGNFLIYGLATPPVSRAKLPLTTLSSIFEAKDLGPLFGPKRLVFHRKLFVLIQYFF